MVLGGVDIEKDETYDQAVQVERAVVHEQYRESPFALHNDIGEVPKQGSRSLHLRHFAIQ